MKNATLSDLNTHLFAQLERLNNPDLAGEKLNEEIERSKAISSVSKDIVSNAALALKAVEFKAEYGLREMPLMLGEKTDAKG